MQITRLNIGLVTVASLLAIPFATAQSASAQCVQAHTGVQLSIGQSPAEQTHNTEFEKDEDCTGNVSSTTSTQLNIGGKNPRQHQEVRHETRRGRNSTSKINRPTVSVDAVAPVNVQTPENFPY